LNKQKVAPISEDDFLPCNEYHRKLVSLAEQSDTQGESGRHAEQAFDACEVATFAWVEVAAIGETKTSLCIGDSFDSEVAISSVLRLQVANRDCDCVWVSKEADERKRAAKWQSVGFVDVHAVKARDASFTNCLGATVLEGLSDVAVAKEGAVKLGVGDERNHVHVDLAIHEGFASCAKLREAGVGDRNWGCSGGTEVGDREKSENVLDALAGKSATLLLSEDADVSASGICELNVRDVNADDLVLIKVQSDRGNHAAFGFVRETAVVRISESRGGQSVNARDDDGITFATSFWGKGTGESTKRRKTGGECVQDFLSIDFVVECSGHIIGLVEIIFWLGLQGWLCDWLCRKRSLRHLSEIQKFQVKNGFLQIRC